MFVAYLESKIQGRKACMQVSQLWCGVYLCIIEWSVWLLCYSHFLLFFYQPCVFLIPMLPARL
jgi:hypothetical protein